MVTCEKTGLVATPNVILKKYKTLIELVNFFDLGCIVFDFE